MRPPVPSLARAALLGLLVVMSGCLYVDTEPVHVKYQEGDVLVVRVTEGGDPAIEAWWSEEPPLPPAEVTENVSLVVYKGDVAVGEGLVTVVEDRAVGVWWSSLTGTPVTRGDAFLFELRGTESSERLGLAELEVTP